MQKELGYLLNSSLAWRDILFMKPMEELRPLFQVEGSYGSSEVQSDSLHNLYRKASPAKEMLDNFHARSRSISIPR